MFLSMCKVLYLHEVLEGAVWLLYTLGLCPHPPHLAGEE